VVYSITSRSTFERVERIVERVIRVKDDVSSPTYSSDPYGRSPQSPTTPGGPGARRRAPIVIVGNKRDLYNAREVSTEEARVLAMRLGCDFYETSAKANTNVEAAFKSIVRQIKGTKRGYEGGGVAGAKVGGKKKKCVIL
jgi:GTPase KRas protein